MKIALLLTGHLRTYMHHKVALDHILFSQHDVDVYCGTWSVSQTRLNEELTAIDPNWWQLYRSNLKAAITVNIEDYTKTKPRLNIDAPIDDSRAREHFAAGWHERLYDQWFLVKETFKQIPEEALSQYDLVVRLRYDVGIKELILIPTEGIVIPADVGGWDCSDHLAYGAPSAMKKYCELVDHIQAIHDVHKVDVTHATKLLGFYLKQLHTVYGVKTTTDRSIRYAIEK